MEALTAGILLVLIGGVANGSFGLMLKYAKNWRWEHLWLVYSASAMLLLPWILGLLTVPLIGALRSVDPSVVLLVFVFGIGWGCGSVLYGLSLKLVGMALSYGIVYGLTAAIGSIAPLVLLHKGELLTLRGKVIIAGTLVIVVGVVLSAWAGHLREAVFAGSRDQASRHSYTGNLVAGVLVAVLSGVLSPMLNLSFAFGEPLAASAVRMGADPLFAANSIWAVALAGGFLVNAGYCMYLIWKNKSWSAMSEQRFHYVLGLAMSVLWLSGIVFYGFGGSKLGELRAVVGWPVLNSMAIITANVWGVASGEWRGAGRRPLAVMALSVAILSLGMFIVGWAETLK